MNQIQPLQPASDNAQTIGVIRSVEGTTAQLVVRPGDKPAPPVGTMVTIDTGRALAIGQIVGMHRPDITGQPGEQPGLIDIELVGELPQASNGSTPRFRRGVSVAPRLGDPAKQIEHEVLAAISKNDNAINVRLGHLHQDPTIPAFVETDEMLSKHFAIVGSTGTGKSCTVALVLRQVLEQHPNAHIVLLDPHDEYPNSFGVQAESIPLDKLNLPYWCLTFEEIVEVILGDSADNREEVELLREFIPLAKQKFASERDRESSLRKNQGQGGDRFSVDVPIPYRMTYIIEMINTEMGKLERPRDLDIYKRLKSRIQTVSQDPRFAFMFGGFAIQDTLKSLLKQIFRVPVQGKPITIVSLKGLPSEIINVVVSVLARLTFDLAIYSRGRLPITFVCEEAHRYVPADGTQGFAPTKRSVSRIAKEGRKYGASLCVVSQRPADLDPTILSQCSTVFAMRLSNERDQAIIASAMSDASRPLLKSLPLLGTREAVLFGEAVNLPARIVLDLLPENALPHGGTTIFSKEWSRTDSGDDVLDGIISQWRFKAGGGRRQDEALERLQQSIFETDDDDFMDEFPEERPPGYGIAYSGVSGAQPGAPQASSTTITAYPHSPYAPTAPDRRAVRSLPVGGFTGKHRS